MSDPGSRPRQAPGSSPGQGVRAAFVQSLALDQAVVPRSWPGAGLAGQSGAEQAHAIADRTGAKAYYGICPNCDAAITLPGLDPKKLAVFPTCPDCEEPLTVFVCVPGGESAKKQEARR